MSHLYIHIPFCHRRCAYCDFNTYANLEHRIEAYVVALCSELRMLAEHPLAPPASPEAAALGPTIFFGGGTPTMLSLNQFERILSAAAALVPLAHAEITSEANPGTVLSPDYLHGLRSLGLNRLSMGVQSLDDPTLRVLGRIHTAAEARRSYEQAREAGFANINLDFIFGLPGQSQTQWEQTLAEVATWGVDHFSLYSLIVEEQTPLHAQVTAGRISVPDDDVTAAMYETAIERLAAAGYEHYEISNWARRTEEQKNRRTEEQKNRRTEEQVDADALSSQSSPLTLHPSSLILHPSSFVPPLASRHNLAYWLNSDYLAAGAGAHGHRYPQRYANLRGVDEYIAAVNSGRLPVAEQTALSPHDLRAETMMMGLRLNIGVSEAHFAARCGQSLDEAYGATLNELVALDLIERTAARVRLTPRGRMLGNQVCARFL